MGTGNALEEEEEEEEEEAGNGFFWTGKNAMSCRRETSM